MSFDAARYKSEVLRPLGKDRARQARIEQVIRDLQAPGLGAEQALRVLIGIDLAPVFDVDATLRDADLSAHLRRVVATCDKSTGTGAQLVKRLLEQLRTVGCLVDSASFWAAHERLRIAERQAEIRRFVEQLAPDFPLGVITPDELDEVAAAQGLGGVPSGDLAVAAGAAGLHVHPDFELPSAPLPSAIGEALERPELRTVADLLLFGEPLPSGVQVIDRTTYGEPPVELSLDMVGRAMEAARRRDDDLNHLVQRALTQLRETCPTPAHLQELVLGQAGAATAALLRRGMPRSAARTELVALGVNPVDAARLVTKLAGTTSVQRLSDVLDRLAQGLLGEAQRLLEVIASTPEDRAERERIETAVRAATDRKTALVADSRRALVARDFNAAAVALRAALAIDHEDEDLEQRLTQLPPEPPTGVRLRIDGRRIVVTWSASTDGGVTFGVVRSTSRVPANPRDGEVLAQGISDLSYTDEHPPVAQTARYAVFATRSGGLHSDGGSAATLVLPPPTELAAAASLSELALSWTAPQEALGVQVTQVATDGGRVTHPASNTGRLSVTGLVTGQRYHFSATAIYLVGDKRRESEPATIDDTPRGVVLAASDLRVDDLPAGGQGGHRISWRTVVGYPVELWAVPVSVSVAPAVRHEFEALRGLGGRRLTVLSTREQQGRTIVDLPSLDDVVRLVPVSVDGEGGLAGASAVAGSAPAVRDPRADVFGHEVRVTWEWPAGDHLMRATWTSAGHARSLDISRNKYNADAGLKLPNASMVSGIGIATVVTASGEQFVSRPVAVPYAAKAARVRYDLRLKRAWRTGRATATVVAQAVEFRGGLPVLAVRKEGRLMPGSWQDGDVVARTVLDFTTAGPITWEVAVGKVSPDYWVRVFLDESGLTALPAGVLLVDPPTTQMRG